MGEEDKEVAAYEAAEAIRRDILKRPLKVAEGSIRTLTKAFEQHAAYTSADALRAAHTNRSGGLMSSDVVEQSNSLLKILNDNALLVHRWREKLFELLTLPVEAENEEVPLPGQGQEVENPEEEYYAKALQAQGESEYCLTPLLTRSRGISHGIRGCHCGSEGCVIEHGHPADRNRNAA